jgi:hypothetical protein
MHLTLTSGFKGIAVIAFCSFLLSASLPEAWELFGSARGDYEAGLDPSASYNGAPSTCLKAKTSASPEGFAGLQPATGLDLNPFRGKRVRFSAYIKAQGVNGWAGMWMRVNGAMDRKNRHSSTLAYDNMQNRPITGTSEWKRYSVVLDVPAKVREINLGITLTGTGAVWLNGVKVEVVGKEVPTTGVR